MKLPLLARRLVFNLFSVIFFLSISYCRGESTPAIFVAEGFLDAHYVRIDLVSAKKYCHGLARSRIDEEIRLTEGRQIDSAADRPRVYYRLLEENVRSPSVVSLRYRLDLDVGGIGRLEKSVLLTLRGSEGDWYVVNFREFD